MTDFVESYKRCRPTRLEDVVGQPDAVKVLRRKLSTGTLPHVVLLHGPTGSGKTTLARIIALAVGVSEFNVVEINCADERGMALARSLAEDVDRLSLDGNPGVYILDEAVQLPRLTQQASLTLLENVSKGYVIFCTTSLDGLLPTFLGRCFVVELRPLDDRSVGEVVLRACPHKEGFSYKVLGAITTQAQGNARKALQLLDKVLTSAKEEEQLNLLAHAGLEPDKVEFLARLLMQRKPWAQVKDSIKGVEDKNVESLRRQVLAYCGSVLLGGGKDAPLAYLVIRAFEEPWFNSGKAGLYAACWDCVTRR